MEIKKLRTQNLEPRTLLFLVWVGVILVRYILMLGERGRVW